MRKTRLSIVLVFALLGTPTLMGASITMTLTPNPGGAKDGLKGHGKWAMAKGEKFESISFHTTLKDSTPVQFSKADATVAGAKWSSTLLLAPETYSPTKVTLYFRDAANKRRSVTVNVTTDQVVK